MGAGCAWTCRPGPIYSRSREIFDRVGFGSLASAPEVDVCSTLGLGRMGAMACKGL